MSTERVETAIMGQSFALTVPSHELEDLHAAVARVNAAMLKIHDAGKIKARDRIAVLAALNIAFEAHQAQQPSASHATPEAGHSEATECSDAGLSQRLQNLIAQLDQALSQDGQLL